jgi:hypothetical protein
MVGWFMGSANFGGGNFTSAGSADMFIAKYNASGAPVWSKRIGGTLDDRALGVTVDPNTGEVVVVGYFQSTLIDFGGVPITGSGIAQLYVVKYAADGAFRWVRNIAGTSGATARGVTVDGSGAIIFAGYFRGSIDFGLGSITGAGSTDGFLAKLNSTGTTQWARPISSTADDDMVAVAVDSAGSIVVGGWTTGTLNLTGTPITSAGNRDALVAKYSAAGVCQWAKLFGDADNQTPVSIAVDGSGNIALAGSFLGSIRFAPQATMTNGSNADIFLVKLDPSGNGVWSTQIGNPYAGAAGPSGTSVAMDGAGNTLLTGMVSGGFDLGIFLPGTTTSTYDLFVSKYSSTGTLIWAKRTQGDGTDQGQAVTFKPNGHPIVAGYFTSSVDFGCGPLANPAYMNAVVLAELEP